MQSPLHKLKTLISERGQSCLPKGELWMGDGLFKAAGLADTLENHFRLADRLGQDVVCLSVAGDGEMKPDLGYRYFSIKDIHEAVHACERPVFAVLDGPFQNMVNTLGLMEVLTTWATDRDDLVKVYKSVSEKCLALLARVLDHSPSAVVITDDMAFDNGPLISPSDIDALCSPFYSRAVKQVKDCGIPVLLHSCGNITTLVPVIKSWEINGFAAVQSGLNDLEALYQAFDSDILILGGIEGDMLETYPFEARAEQKLTSLISGLGATGNLVLGSSSGLYKEGFLQQIERIYAFADAVGRD